MSGKSNLFVLIIYQYIDAKNEDILLKYQHHRYGELQTEFEVKEIGYAETDGGGVWYPKKAYRTHNSKRFGNAKYQLTVHAFTPNVEVDENTFQFDFPDGTHVYDRVSEIDYIVGE